jgi:hypothetical protein
MKIFISGSVSISNLNPEAILELKKIIESNFEVLVGDADGVDKLVQSFLADKKYNNITVYSMKDTRNNVGNWNVLRVQSDLSKETREYYKEKDKKMAENADYGFAIWDRESEGTLNNMINLLNANKKVCLFINHENMFYNLNTLADLEDIITSSNSEKLASLYKRLSTKHF